jgi:hypothetical protein
MKRLCAALGMIAVSGIASMPVAGADQPPAKKFEAVLSAKEVVPPCERATNAARGHASFTVQDEAFGAVSFGVGATNLPGDEVSSIFIFRGPPGIAGQEVQRLPFLPERGRIEKRPFTTVGAFANVGLLAEIRAHPNDFYVQIQTSPPGVGCPNGAIRGQLDDHGPLNN